MAGFGGDLGGADGCSLKFEPLKIDAEPDTSNIVVGGGFGVLWSIPGDPVVLLSFSSASPLFGMELVA